jgi:glycosyltransferase involved in cell wall biosynthesis
MGEPIRILHILGSLNRGGAETMIMNLYRNIDRSKIQFDFVVHTANKCDYDDEIREMGGIIHNVPRYIGKNHFKYKKAWYELFESHPEYKIIHGHMRSTAAIYLKIAKKYGLVTIAHSHSTASRGNKLEQIFKNILQLPIRYTADYLFACSDEAAQWLFGKNVVNKDNYKVIKNAIDVEKYIFNDYVRKRIRKVLNFEDKFIVGHVGSFSHPKNHKFLIEIFHQILNHNHNSILLLIGDGELRLKIKRIVAELGLTESVIFTGIRPDIPELLQAMDILVFPSLFEGIPVTLVEAQAAGLKIIAADTITEEVALTDLVRFISLKQPASYWADNVLYYINGYERRNTFYEICKADYDVEKNSKWLEEFYINEYKSK